VSRGRKAGQNKTALDGVSRKPHRALEAARFGDYNPKAIRLLERLAYLAGLRRFIESNPDGKLRDRMLRACNLERCGTVRVKPGQGAEAAYARATRQLVLNALLDSFEEGDARFFTDLAKRFGSGARAVMPEVAALAELGLRCGFETPRTVTELAAFVDGVLRRRYHPRYRGSVSERSLRRWAADLGFRASVPGRPRKPGN
jgi:hypothetical protein